MFRNRNIKFKNMERGLCMKRVRLLLFMLVLVFAAPAVLFAQDEAASESTAPSKIGIDLGVEYWSTYYWRGQQFYGAGKDVFFPWIGYSLPGNFYISAIGEVAGEYLSVDTDNAPNDTEKDWVGVDLGVSWSTGIADNFMTVGAQVWYYWYPNSREDTRGGAINDFMNFVVSLSFNKLPLSPTVKYSQYYRVDKNKTGNSGDQYKDIYVELALGHTFKLDDHVGFTLGASTSYFNYASPSDENEASGWLDVKLTTKLVFSKGDYSIYGGFNAGYIPMDEFNDHAWYGDSWVYYCTFGASYSL